MSADTETYQGICYCGACSVSTAGEPMVMAYCHCHSCRKWHSAPVNAWCLWAADNVSLSGPTVQSDKNDESHRVSCGKCGGALVNIKPGKDIVAVYAMSLAESALSFEPTFHIFYGERVFDMADGLPKWKTVPTSFGGDGVAMPEPDKTGWISLNTRAQG